jgi:uncharacterized membrane protein YcjF (UPF0283 family)
MNSPNLRRVSWWRLVLGLLLLLGGLSNLDRSSIAPDLMPSNETQWFGFYLAAAVFIIAGLLLVFFGVRRAWSKPPE